MSVFRKHESIVDRAASDRTRHKKKIEKAIKDLQTDLFGLKQEKNGDGTAYSILGTEL